MPESQMSSTFEFVHYRLDNFDIPFCVPPMILDPFAEQEFIKSK